MSKSYFEKNLNTFAAQFKQYLQTSNSENLQLEVGADLNHPIVKLISPDHTFTLHMILLQRKNSSGVKNKPGILLKTENQGGFKALAKRLTDNSHFLFAYNAEVQVDLEVRDQVFLIKNKDALNSTKTNAKTRSTSIKIVDIRQAQVAFDKDNGAKKYPEDFAAEKYVITNFANLFEILKELQAYNDNLADSLASAPVKASGTSTSKKSSVASKKSKETTEKSKATSEKTKEASEKSKETTAKSEVTSKKTKVTTAKSEVLTQNFTENSAENSSEKSNSLGIQLGVEELTALVLKKKYLKPFKAYCEEFNLSANEHPITVDFKKNQEDDFALIINSSSPQAILDKEKFRTFLLKDLTENLKVELLQSIEFTNNLKLPQDSSSLFNFAKSGLSAKKETPLKKLKILGCDLLDVSAVTDMSGMFSFLEFANPEVSNWDVSCVTNMENMFHSAVSATPDVSNWDVANVINMSGMFANANQANPNVATWNVANVTNMSGMFEDARGATPDVSKWDVSKVTNMSHMFKSAYKATPDVSKWDVSNVTNMSYMFDFALEANPDVSNWNVSAVTNMRNMFSDTKKADPDVSNWDVSSVTDMGHMFESAKQADPEVSKWNVSNVTNMAYMFAYTAKATPDVENWDVSSVVSMSYMFSDAVAADPDVGNWNVSSVVTMECMFFCCEGIMPNVINWNVSSRPNINLMFYGTDTDYGCFQNAWEVFADYELREALGDDDDYDDSFLF